MDPGRKLRNAVRDMLAANALDDSLAPESYRVEEFLRRCEKKAMLFIVNRRMAKHVCGTMATSRITKRVWRRCSLAGPQYRAAMGAYSPAQVGTRCGVALSGVMRRR